MSSLPASPLAGAESSGPMRRQATGTILPTTRRSFTPVWQGLQWLWRLLQREGHLRAFASRPKRMRISETVSLGEKRYVSLLEVDGQSFLIGSSAQTISLLASCTPPQPTPGDFEQILHSSSRGVSL